MKIGQLKKKTGLVLAGVLLSAAAVCLFPTQAVYAYGEEEKTYCGGGTATAANYTVSYSSLVTEGKALYSAPSYQWSDSSYPNFCAALTGLNLVVYYDRWCMELIPDFTPGVSLSAGYLYATDRSKTATVNAFYSLYSLMKTDSTGTTSSNFKSGLSSYVQSAGYGVSYSSLYSTSTNVNLDVLASAVDNEKVGLLILDSFNFVTDISVDETSHTATVTKSNYTATHIMMVYGYQIYSYYNASGSLLRKDTFLCACSAFESGEKGYILMDDNLTIDEAYIVTIA